MEELTDDDVAIFLNYHDRERNRLLVLGDPGHLCRELDLHHLAHGRSPDPLVRQLLYDGLAAMALYVVSRPRFDSFAWTVSLQEPRMNLFFGGSARDGTVVGRVFLKNVEPRDTNLFHAQASRPRSDVQHSSVPVEGLDIFGMVEQFCRQSDQQRIRFFHEPGGSRVVLAQAFSEADHETFDGLTPEEVFSADTLEGVKLLVRREIGFRCGCHKDRVLEVIVPLYGGDIDDLFQGDPAIQVECPRCAAAYTVARGEYEEALERFRER